MLLLPPHGIQGLPGVGPGQKLTQPILIFDSVYSTFSHPVSNPKDEPFPIKGEKFFVDKNFFAVYVNVKFLFYPK